MKQVCWHSRRSKAYGSLPEARMAALRLLRMCWSSGGLPRLLLPPLTASSESEKMTVEDVHLAPNPRILLGSCAPSSAVSVAGGWWVAAVGFVVVLQRYRSCGSWRVLVR